MSKDNNNMKTKLQTLEKLLQNHDWFYQYSDDYSVYERGQNAWNTINEVIEYFENTEEYEKCGELLEEKYAKEHADFDIFIHRLAESNGVTNY